MRREISKRIVFREKQKREEEQANLREWWYERIAIMTADGNMTDFQAQQACHNILLQRRKRQKEMFA